MEKGFFKEVEKDEKYKKVSQDYLQASGQKLNPKRSKHFIIILIEHSKEEELNGWQTILKFYILALPLNKSIFY